MSSKRGKQKEAVEEDFEAFGSCYKLCSFNGWNQ